ncbi:hypothetical protein BCR33DRAFT_725437 [Rhizoclosmatium globosum]|uniref:BTB domain-containing protein n=1 Tax=Rhizoclosmatium globosum TaxID=329046 RepID=A0A1Y2AYA6_9FUNG|nr:hypothetical protein BCR33DRAFT_725437 [Rhizoclosmatium globosum]|eukprot:ORY27551.1 hypothetical protein BCR33DRAFT_725437 [Rhizoclosmatium globosum]
MQSLPTPPKTLSSLNPMSRQKTSDRRASFFGNRRSDSQSSRSGLPSAVPMPSTLFSSSSKQGPEAALDPKPTVVFSKTTLNNRMANVCNGLHKHGYVDSLFSDIVVTILGHPYHLHRLALINNPYFSMRMLEVHGDVPTSSTGKFELSVDIKDPNVSHDALSVLFRRLYGFFGDTVETDNLKSLLATAYFFRDQDLCDMCADFIKTIKYTPQNALEYLTYSSTYDYGETSLLLLRHTLIYLCREGSVDPHLATETFPQLEFSWLARIVQSDTFYIPTEFNRFEFISAVLAKKFEGTTYGSMKTLIQHMTSHVLALGRLPAIPIVPGSPNTTASALTNHHHTDEDVNVTASEPVTGSANVVFLGRLAQVTSPSLPPAELSPDSIDAAINLLSKGLLYAHIPLHEYSKVRAEAMVPGFVFDRHFRIHHDMIRLVETTPKNIQKLGVNYHYGRQNVVVKGDVEGFYESIMGPVYAHDLLEMPPFRFGVEFGGVKQAQALDGKSNGVVGNMLVKVLKGNVGDCLVSKGVPYAGSLWAIKIEKGVEEGLNSVEFSLTRKPGSKDVTDCVDSRSEAKFWCRIVAYVCLNEQVTEAYAFESSGVHFLGQSTRIGSANVELFKELYVAGGVDATNVSVRLSVLLGVL